MTNSKKLATHNGCHPVWQLGCHASVGAIPAVRDVVSFKRKTDTLASSDDCAAKKLNSSRCRAKLEGSTD